MKIFFTLLITLSLISLLLIFSFRSEKKKYSPLKNTSLTEKEKTYVIKMLNRQLAENISGNIGNTCNDDILYLISLVKFDNLNQI